MHTESTQTYIPQYPSTLGKRKRDEPQHVDADIHTSSSTGKHSHHRSFHLVIKIIPDPYTSLTPLANTNIEFQPPKTSQTTTSPPYEFPYSYQLPYPDMFDPQALELLNDGYYRDGDEVRDIHDDVLRYERAIGCKGNNLCPDSDVIVDPREANNEVSRNGEQEAFNDAYTIELLTTLVTDTAGVTAPNRPPTGLANEERPRAQGPPFVPASTEVSQNIPEKHLDLDWQSALNAGM